MKRDRCAEETSKSTGKVGKRFTHQGTKGRGGRVGTQKKKKKKKKKKKTKINDPAKRRVTGCMCKWGGGDKKKWGGRLHSVLGPRKGRMEDRLRGLIKKKNMI